MNTLPNGKHLHGRSAAMYFIQLIVDRNPEMMYLFTLPFTVYWRADWPCKAIFERLHFPLGKSHVLRSLTPLSASPSKYLRSLTFEYQNTLLTR